jgi:hypothetical protein
MAAARLTDTTHREGTRKRGDEEIPKRIECREWCGEPVHGINSGYEVEAKQDAHAGLSPPPSFAMDSLRSFTADWYRISFPASVRLRRLSDSGGGLFHDLKETATGEPGEVFCRARR